MRSVLYVRSQSSSYIAANPMAVAMRNAVANQYGFVPSDDPFEFNRQLIKAKADAIEAELKANEAARKAEERKAARKAARLAKQAVTDARKERQIVAAEEKIATRKGFAVKFVNTQKTVPTSGRPRCTETVAEKTERLDRIEKSADQRELWRQYGKYGKAVVAADKPVSPWEELKKAHMADVERAARERVEREAIISKLQSIAAFTPQMMEYNSSDLRRTLARIEKARQMVAGVTPVAQVTAAQASNCPASTVRTIGFDGHSIGEDERERVIFTTRRVRGQLPRNLDGAPMLELLANLKAHCERKGLKWFAELWPNATQVACPVAPIGQRLEMSAQKSVAQQASGAVKTDKAEEKAKAKAKAKAKVVKAKPEVILRPSPAAVTAHAVDLLFAGIFGDINALAE